MQTTVSHEEILNSIGEGVFLFDPDLRLIAMNRAAEEDFLPGGSRDVLGRFLFHILPWLADSMEPLAAAAGEGRSCFLRSVPSPRGNTWARLTPYVCAGRINGSVLTVGGVPASPAGRDELAFESMEGLISQIAHEINNPLGGIRGAAQLLSEKLQPEQGEYVGVILKEVDRLAGILRDLMDFASPARPPRRPLNIHEVMDQALAVLGPSMDGISIRRYYDPSLPDVLGDGSKLLQVFINLFKNAAEAMAETPDAVIEIQTRPSEQYVHRRGHICRWAEIRIEDNGPGIPQGHMDRIFLPYRSGKKRGSGLGLAIVKKILIGHHGMIRAENNAAGGAAFRAYVPFAEPSGCFDDEP